MAATVTVAGLLSSSVHAQPADRDDARAPTPAMYDRGDPHTRGRTLALTGASLGSAGLLLGVTGFGTLAGIRAANPGPGPSLESDDPAHLRRTLRLARSMEVLAWAGVSLGVTGGILATVGGVLLRKSRRRNGNVAFAPGIQSVSLSVRF